MAGIIVNIRIGRIVDRKARAIGLSTRAKVVLIEGVAVSFRFYGPGSLWRFAVRVSGRVFVWQSSSRTSDRFVRI